MRKARALSAPEKPKPRKKEPKEAGAPWRAVVFGDLHVSAKTLDRACDVLRDVGKIAKERQAQIVCVGDFWDLRGVLNVRQLDSVLNAIDGTWAGTQAIIIPGNHDQVSADGTIHGVRVFSPFPNIRVATDPTCDSEIQCAYIPWREDSGEQAKAFDWVPEGWTVFGHAEVEGATTNYAHKALGKVRVAQMSRFRACYLGHYHKRQLLGDRTWYIGSPFEQNFGEMGDPKGVALVSSDSVEPEFLDFKKYPKHVRCTFGAAPPKVSPSDIVEVRATAEQIGSKELAEFVSSLGAENVRSVQTAKAEDSSVPPPVATSLDQAIDAYVASLALSTPEEQAAAKAVARSILAELPEARSIDPASPKVRILSVEATDFCALRGTVRFDLDKAGMLLLKGPIAIGKTAILDALTWGLYGTTSPRKAGVQGAALRADEVIHDGADFCEVKVQLELADSTAIEISRSKDRGAGAKIQIQATRFGDPKKIAGAPFLEGISDQQERVNRIVGLPFQLWRVCVSLGQGAVGNFVTDADKRRKELLQQAFGLSVCEAAVKEAKSRIKPLAYEAERLTTEILMDERTLAALETANFEDQSRQWEEHKAAAKEAAKVAGEEAKRSIAACEQHLVGEAEWLTTKGQAEQRIGQLTKALGDLSTGRRASELEREVGSIQAECAMLDRTLGLKRLEIEKLMSMRGVEPIPCPACGRPFDPPDAERHIAEIEQEILRTTEARRSQDLRMRNAVDQMGTLRKSHAEERSVLDKQIAESRAALDKCGEALNAISRLKGNKQDGERRLAEARERWLREDAAQNPFAAKVAELSAQIDATNTLLGTKRWTLEDVRSKERALAIWVDGFGPNGIPVIVLRSALQELESYANRFLTQLLGGRLWCGLSILDDDLQIKLYEQTPEGTQERRYEQLSGGQRRCVELAFSPFALSEMVFNRCGVSIPLLLIDELTTHLGQDEKPLVCDVLRQLNRETVVVIDHDMAVQAEFDQVYEVRRGKSGVEIHRAA